MPDRSKRDNLSSGRLLESRDVRLFLARETKRELCPEVTRLEGREVRRGLSVKEIFERFGRPESKEGLMTDRLGQ